MKGSSSIWRFIRMSIQCLAYVVAICLLLLVAINSFDEELAPETRALMLTPPNPFRPEQNLNLALLGFDAPPGQSTMAYGQAKLAKYEASFRNVLADPGRTNDWLTDQDPQAMVFKGDLDFLKPLASSIWSDAASHRQEIDAALNDNRELYRRYLALHSLPGYYELATPSPLSPVAVYPQKVRQLFLADVALRMKSHEAKLQKQALVDLGSDLRMWRTVVVGEASLLSTMLAVAALHGDLLLLADMTADPAIDLTGFETELDRLTMPFDVADWKVGKMFAYEFRFVLSMLDQVDYGKESLFSLSGAGTPGVTNWWDRLTNRFLLHFYQRQATENMQAHAMAELTRLADAEPRRILALHDAFAEQLREKFGFGIDFVYNPVGKILIGIGAENYESYPLRVYDVAALQRLVKLSYDIRHQSIPTKEIPYFMQRHPEWSTHPVSGQFLWNADKSEISLVPLARQRADKRFGVLIRSAQ